MWGAADTHKHTHAHTGGYEREQGLKTQQGGDGVRVGSADSKTGAVLGGRGV